MAGLPSKADKLFGAKAATDAVTMVIFWSLSFSCHCHYSFFVLTTASRDCAWRSFLALCVRILKLRASSVFHWTSAPWLYNGHYTRVGVGRRINDQPGHHRHLYRSNLPGS